MSDTPAELLDDVAAFIHTYVVLKPEEADACALWVTHTHTIRAFNTTPRLWISSPVPGSGKTKLIDVLDLLVAAPHSTLNITGAALFRTLKEKADAKKPITLLHDEVDGVFGDDPRDGKDLRHLFNAGWQRGKDVVRCTGNDHTPTPFPSFCPVVLAGLQPNKMPPTLVERSIPIRMKKKLRGEKIERLRMRKVKPRAQELHDKLAEWARTGWPRLANAEPEMPDELTDRQQDAWEPLLAVADLVGGGWPERARQAATTLNGIRGDERSVVLDLLGDIADVLTQPELWDEAAIPSTTLAARLARIEGSRWAEYDRNKNPITTHALARLLRPLDIEPGTVHDQDGRSLRGYSISHLAEAIERNVPAHPFTQLRSARLRDPRSEALFGLEPESENEAEMPSDQHPRTRALAEGGNGTIRDEEGRWRQR
jgi:hypothetical protein